MVNNEEMESLKMPSDKESEAVLNAFKKEHHKQ